MNPKVMVEETRAVTALKQRGIAFMQHEYPAVGGPVAAIEVAEYMGFQVERLIKTLVTTDHHGGYYVFCLPAADYVVEIGPGGGEEGGRVIFEGTPQEMLDSSASVTAPYLRASCR